MSTIELTLEAIRLLRDWSQSLIVLETALIAFVGTLIKTTPERLAFYTALATLFCLLGSILAGVNVIASLPSAVGAAPETTPRGLYDLPANLRGTIRTSAAAQGTLFVAGLVFLAFFVVLRRSAAPDDDEN
ncbi:MAG: hypothetical protein AAFR35_08495 [Pseudomonadota bacterium]